MARPRSILWVDDEVESLTSHVLFLEQQGFMVERAAHGDDALVLLQRQPYGVVLLDEQMPGRRGLDLFRAIRAIDQTLPVVMVTKSEEPETLKDAIGAEISDYLIKPASPRQILSVVTRLLEGDRIRQQRLSRDFATRFRELEAGRRAGMGWREWIALVVELAEWEVRLGQADEPGLQDALRTLQGSLRGDFAHFVAQEYPRWLRSDRAGRPPLSIDIGSEFLAPVLERHGKALLVVVDCLRLDQWEVLRPIIGTRFDIETVHYLSILPTATPFARNAIFSGLLPAELARRYPEWWKDTDETSLNAHEGELLQRQMKRLTGRDVPVRYEKVFTSQDGEALLRRLPTHLAQPGITALVFNFIDQLTHGRTENSTLFEVARDAPALRSLTRTWFERSPLWGALRAADTRGVPVLVTTDHGWIHCHTPATVFAKRDATLNLRYKFGDDLRIEDPEAAIVVDDLSSYGLPERGADARLLLATGDRFFVYPTKLREYQARYRGAFLHGGVAPEEMVLPIALLTPHQGR
ncbi:MAG TPA: response regulator [Gemmatimonadales bacterium]|jgi:CheY-like chemotaxis protein|nr:response regulator [Gemmatimonadales bacterium]